MAYNAQFERVCLSLPGALAGSHQWRCTMVMAAYLTLPGRLADAAVALGTTERKWKRQDLSLLLRPTSLPTNGGRTACHRREKWSVYRRTMLRMETERAIRKALEKYPLPEQEWELYAGSADQRPGVRVDKKLVKNAGYGREVFAQTACQRAKELTGLENGSVNQLKAWLADQDMPMESLPEDRTGRRRRRTVLQNC